MARAAGGVLGDDRGPDLFAPRQVEALVDRPYRADRVAHQIAVVHVVEVRRIVVGPPGQREVRAATEEVELVTADRVPDEPRRVPAGVQRAEAAAGGQRRAHWAVR